MTKKDMVIAIVSLIVLVCSLGTMGNAKWNNDIDLVYNSSILVTVSFAFLFSRMTKYGGDI